MSTLRVGTEQGAGEKTLLLGYALDPLRWLTLSGDLPKNGGEGVRKGRRVEGRIASPSLGSVDCAPALQPLPKIGPSKWRREQKNGAYANLPLRLRKDQRSARTDRAVVEGTC